MEDIDVTAVKYLEELISYIKDGRVSVNHVDVYNDTIEIYDGSAFPNRKTVGYTLTVDYVIHDNKKEESRVKFLVSKEDPNKQELIQRLHPFNVEFLDFKKNNLGVVRCELLDFEDEPVILYGAFSNTEVQFLINKGCTVIRVSGIFV